MLSDFFRINLPYGMVRDKNNHWMAFNREYKPIGYNTNEPVDILFEHITSISPFEARIEVLLQCGELYIFSTTDNVRTHINIYNRGGNTKNPKPVTAQDVARNIWDGLEKTLAIGKKQD